MLKPVNVGATAFLGCIFVCNSRYASPFARGKNINVNGECFRC
jgi:hypothetical protein